MLKLSAICAMLACLALGDAAVLPGKSLYYDGLGKVGGGAVLGNGVFGQQAWLPGQQPFVNQPVVKPVAKAGVVDPLWGAGVGVVGGVVDPLLPVGGVAKGGVAKVANGGLVHGGVGVGSVVKGGVVNGGLVGGAVVKPGGVVKGGGLVNGGVGVVKGGGLVNGGVGVVKGGGLVNGGVGVVKGGGLVNGGVGVVKGGGLVNGGVGVVKGGGLVNGVDQFGNPLLVNNQAFVSQPVHGKGGAFFNNGLGAGVVNAGFNGVINNGFGVHGGYYDAVPYNYYY